MKKWEYEAITNCSPLRNPVLNHYGDLGWELVSMTSFVKPAIGKHGVVEIEYNYVFKREKK